MNGRWHISSDYLRQRAKEIRDYHNDLAARYPGQFNEQSHHGIVPDMINEILRSRGEAIEEFPWQHFPAFKLDA